MFMAKRFALALAMSCVSEGAIAQAPQAEKYQPWWPSKYGAEDTLGAVNNLSPELVKKAAKLIKTGKTYRLGVETGPESAAYGNRTFTTERTPGPSSDFTSTGFNRVTSFDEKIAGSMGVGTQIDGFGHLGIDHHYYNGITGAKISSTRILQPSDLPPIVTRGVLIDMVKHYKRPLKVGDIYNKAEITAAAKAQGVKIGKGDVVLFHTGWMVEKMLSDKNLYRSNEPGIGEEGAQYLADLGVIAVGSDTIALEALPSPPGKTFIVHQTLLAKNGVHILETVRTDELAKDNAKEFMFVLGVPRIVGTVQSVINPIAIR